MFPCNLCQNETFFASARLLQSHLDTTKHFKCVVSPCPRAFFTEEGLSAHVRDIHANVAQASSQLKVVIPANTNQIEPSHSLFNCVFTGCSNTFSTETARKTHHEQVHSVGVSHVSSPSSSVTTTVGVDHKKSKPTRFQCTFNGCGRSFATKAGRTSHCKALHTGEGSQASTSPSTSSIATTSRVFLRSPQPTPSEIQAKAITPVIISKTLGSSFDNVPSTLRANADTSNINDVPKTTACSVIPNLSLNTTTLGEERDSFEAPQAMPNSPASNDKTTTDGDVSQTTFAVCRSPVIFSPIQNKLPHNESTISTTAGDTASQVPDLRDATGNSPAATVNEAKQNSPSTPLSPLIIELSAEKSAVPDAFTPKSPINDVLVDIDTGEPLVFEARLRSPSLAGIDSTDEEGRSVDSSSSQEPELLPPDELVLQDGHPDRSDDSSNGSSLHDGASFFQNHPITNRSIVSIRNVSPQVSDFLNESVTDNESSSSDLSYESCSSTPFFEAHMSSPLPSFDGQEVDQVPIVLEQIMLPRNPEVVGGPINEYASTNESVSNTSKFYCRICRSDPCDGLTVTTCGHLFCYECIARHVMLQSRCPVCRNVMLLYCLFKIDLET